MKIARVFLYNFLLPPIKIDNSPVFAFKLPPEIGASIKLFNLFPKFFFKRLKQLKELVEQSIHILFDKLSIIFFLPMAIDLICFGPGKHEINISENLIISSSEEEDSPPRELNSLIIFLLNNELTKVDSFEIIKLDNLILRHFVTNNHNELYEDLNGDIYISADKKGIYKINFTNFR